MEEIVLSTEEERGIATMTISTDADEDHTFDVWTKDDTAFVEYQETLGYRGQIHVQEPDEHIFKSLMVSEQMTRLLNRWDVSAVKRADPQS